MIDGITIIPNEECDPPDANTKKYPTDYSVEEQIRRLTIVNVARERERCAMIAESAYRLLDSVGFPKYQGIRKKFGDLIALKIRSQDPPQ